MFSGEVSSVDYSLQRAWGCQGRVGIAKVLYLMNNWEGARDEDAVRRGSSLSGPEFSGRFSDLARVLHSDR